MSLQLHNTLSGRIEPFEPLNPPDVGLYVCGLTVYSRGHVGNYRTFVAADLLRRTLRYKGYRVRHVMNVTDVDDRIIRFAADAGVDLRAFTAPHVKTFEDDLAALRLERPEVVPRATDHIPEMVELIAALIERGHTYEADGSIYFRIGSFDGYGRLSRLDVSGIQAGARVDSDRYGKEDARDFVLWKRKDDEPDWAQWDAPFGRGRPGWHIECSAMAMKYLGQTFDLHVGGVDLTFPHHENEIAQSECGTGKTFVKHWMHVEHLLIENETMSKSKGNVFDIPDIVARGHSPEAIRYLLCQAHYRKQLNFTWEGLGHAAAALDRIHGFARRLDEVERDGPASPDVGEVVARFRGEFDAALGDDLNSPEALAAVHGLVGEGNARLAGGGLTRGDAELLLGELRSMDTVFGVLLPGEARLSEEEASLVAEREDARKRRDFASADRLRAQLEQRGIVVEDTPKGSRWRRKR